MPVPGVALSPSPYARGAPELIALGYHPLPIMPGEKRPGEYRSGAWRGMSDWQRFRDRQPSEFEARIWRSNYPDANIGVVLGSPAAGKHVIAIDIDIADPDAVDDVMRQLPFTPMRKRGAKGETLFYLGDKSLKSRPYSRSSDRVRLVDVLTGFDARQTVCPPSMHPSGVTYAWTAGPVAASDLPTFDADDLAKMEEALGKLGWDPAAERNSSEKPSSSPRSTGNPVDPDEDDFFSETKREALSRLDAWIPALDLTGARRARGGWEAVATWRPSATGRAIEQRKRNLSIQPNGITDFGDGPRGYSAIDLVMAARGVEQGEATSWLRERLGLDGGGVVIALDLSKSQTQSVVGIPATEQNQSVATVDATVDTPSTLSELPDALTRVPGLLGELTDWICDTSRRPQRGLALGAALTILGTAAGRKYAGPTRTGTHLYVLGLARTGAGKDHALQQIARVLGSCGMGAHVGPSQFMSLPAVIKRLNRTPLTLCAMDEFGSFLERINNRRASPFEKAITGILRTAWGSSFQTMAPPEWAGHDAEPIHSPALSIYGVSTPDEFYKSLSGADVANGFLNRFILLSTRKRPAEREPKADPFVVPASIRDALHRIYGSGSALSNATAHNGRADGPLISATWDSPEAHADYVAFGQAIEQREEEAPLIGRTVEMAQRLATIRAIGIRHDAPRITAADMAWGRDLALWSGERMIAETADHIADTQNQADAQHVLRIVKERGRVKHGDLVRLMQHRVKARDLKDLIAGLGESGQIVIDEVTPAAGGKKVFFYTPL